MGHAMCFTKAYITLLGLELTCQIRDENMQLFNLITVHPTQVN